MSNKLFVNKKSESLRRFSGGIAHDLNNTIMVLDGFSGCLKKTSGLDEKQIRYIDQIDKATAQVEALADMLLTICNGKILNMNYLNLQELLESFIKEKSTVEGFNHKMDLINEPVEIGQIDNIDKTKVYCERNSMLTVLENLYQNSVYPNEESRQISYKITKNNFSQDEVSGDMVPGKYIILDIYDNGPGIEDKISSNIFEPYFSTKPRGKGKGLGLALCAGIIQQYRAFIENIQGIEKGCLIRIYFPDNPQETYKIPDSISDE